MAQTPSVTAGQKQMYRNSAKDLVQCSKIWEGTTLLILNPRFNNQSKPHLQTE